MRGTCGRCWWSGHPTSRCISSVTSPILNTIRLLNACDLVVIPSRNEPFGLVLLEAWSAEKGVVASNVGGLSENIDSFVDGVKVEPQPDTLAGGINAVLGKPLQAGALGKRGREKIDRMFLWGPVGEKMAETYARVIA